MSRFSSRNLNRIWFVALSAAFALALLVLGAGALYAQEDGTKLEPPSETPTEAPAATPTVTSTLETQTPQAANLSTSLKSADTDEARIGDTVGYSIVIANTGFDTAYGVVMTDALPADVTYVTDTLTMTVSGAVPTTTLTISNGVVMAQADLIVPNASFTIMFDVTVNEGISATTVITNSAEITGDGSLLTRSATFTVVEQPPQPVSTTAFMPIIVNPVPAPILNPIGRPNSSNQWAVTWQYSVPNVVNYTVEHANNPEFINSTTETVTGLSYTAMEELAWNNEFYYRVRANLPTMQSDWSNVQTVIGGYLDHFNDSTSGWITRYSTFIEEVRVFYETGNLIIQSEDSWDWGMFSPLRRAPALPYAVEIRNQPAALGNLVSMGLVFSGDWGGSACPDVSSVEGWYTHQNCFTQFYNMNLINKNLFAYDSFKMLFERVEARVWCPTCGGSPMKRIYPTGLEVEPIPNVSSDGWNVYRAEVRESGIKLFINNQLFYTVSGTDSWVDNPYFGVFVSTDEYSNSTWRVDYYKITALDN